MVRRDLSEHDWDEVVDSSPDGWLWHRHCFQDVLLTWPNRSDLGFALIGSDDRPVAVIPAHLVTGKRAGVSMRRIDVLGGPCASGSLDDAGRRATLAAATRALREAAARTRSVHITSTLATVAPGARSDAADGANPLVALGYQDRSDQVWVVDTSGSEEEVWSAVQPRSRKYIRASARAGVALRTMTAADLPTYHRLHLATCARTGAVPHPREYFEAIWRHLVPKGLAYGIVAEHDGVPVAACHVATDRNAGTWWTAASDDRGQEQHANDAVVWEMLKRASHDGLVEVDLGEAHVGGGSSKHLAISAFKRKFGGRLRPLHRGRLMTAGPVRARLVRALESRMDAG